MDGLIDISGESWLRGGTPDESRIVPWGVQSIDHEDIDFWQGRLDSDLVNERLLRSSKNYASGGPLQFDVFDGLLLKPPSGGCTYRCLGNIGDFVIVVVTTDQERHLNLFSGHQCKEITERQVVSKNER